MVHRSKSTHPPLALGDGFLRAHQAPLSLYIVSRDLSTAAFVSAVMELNSPTKNCTKPNVLILTLHRKL